MENPGHGHGHADEPFLHKRDEYDEDDESDEEESESQYAESEEGEEDSDNHNDGYRAIDRTPFDQAGIHVPQHFLSKPLKRELMPADVDLLRAVTAAADKETARPNDKEGFARLYFCYDAFTKANNLSAASYNGYFQCIHVLTRLCNYPQDTWSLRLRHFLHRYSGQNARQKRHLLHAGMLKAWDRHRLLRAWENWQTAFIQRDIYLNNLCAVAEKYDRKQLLKNVIHNWSYKLARICSNRQAADCTYSRRLVEKWFERILLKNDKVQADKVTMVRMVLIRFFYKWQYKIASLWRDELNAVEMREWIDKRNAFAVWRLALAECRKEQRRNRVMATVHLYKWIGKLDALTDQNEQAVAMYDRSLICQAFQVWLQQTRLNTEDYNSAAQIDTTNRRIEVFEYWTKATALKILASPIIKQSNRKSDTVYFYAWRQKTRLLKEAKRFNRFMTQYRILHHWRLMCGERQIARRVNHNIVAERFRDWMLSQRLVLFQRYAMRRVVSKYLIVWTDHTKVSQRKSKSLSRLSHRFLALSLKVKFFTHWKSKYTTLDTALSFARKMHNRSLQKAHFALARQHILNIAISFSQANTLYRTNVRQTLFFRWRQESNIKRHRKVDAAFYKYRKRRTYILVLSAFRLWRDKTETIGDNCVVATKFWQDNGMKRGQDVLTFWVERCNVVSHGLELADDIYRAKILAAALGFWGASYAINQGHQTAADEFLAKNRRAHAERLFLLWRMKSHRVRQIAERADYFFRIQQTHQLKDAWRLWRTNFQDRMVGEVPDGFAGLFDTPSRIQGQPKIPATSRERWHVGSPLILPTPKRLLSQTGSQTLPRHLSRVPRTPSRLGREVTTFDDDD